MRHHHQFVLVAGAVALLAGCASGGGGAPKPPQTRINTQPTLSIHGAVPTARPGELVGRNAQGLVALFGQPALDVREGSGRKLQFSGQNCVLDAYLYPPRGRGEAVVTHVDARSPDGRDADRTACVQALRRR